LIGMVVASALPVFPLATAAPPQNSRVTEIQRSARSLQYWLNLKESCGASLSLSDAASECEREMNTAAAPGHALNGGSNVGGKLYSAVTRATSTLGSAYFN